MAVTLGYMQTDLEIIPIDWGILRIDPLASITTGSRNTQDRVEDGSYPFFVRSQQVEKINTYSYDGEAVLTVGDGVGTGKVFHYINGKFDSHQRVYRISEFSDRLNGHYFFYQFSARFYRRIMSMTAKSSVDSVRMEMIAGMKVPVPPLAEQLAIVAALSDVDALVDDLDRLIAKKRDLKQAAMQQLLTGQTRLPGFHGKWQVKPLRDVANTDPEQLGPHTRKDFAFSYIAIEDVKRGVLRSHSEQVFAEAPSRARRKLRENDILVSTVRPNLQSHLLFKGCDGDWVCSTGFCVVRCREAMAYPPFVFSQMFAEGVTRQIDALLAGSNYPAISSDNVASLAILFPCFDEQVAIAAVLSDMDAEIAALEARRNKTRDLKQAMMQELLTGKTRLVPPEVAHA